MGGGWTYTAMCQERDIDGDRAEKETEREGGRQITKCLLLLGMNCQLAL